MRASLVHCSHCGEPRESPRGAPRPAPFCGKPLTPLSSRCTTQVLRRGATERRACESSLAAPVGCSGAHVSRGACVGRSAPSEYCERRGDGGCRDEDGEPEGIASLAKPHRGCRRWSFSSCCRAPRRRTQRRAVSSSAQGRIKLSGTPLLLPFLQDLCQSGASDRAQYPDACASLVRGLLWLGERERMSKIKSLQQRLPGSACTCPGIEVCFDAVCSWRARPFRPGRLDSAAQWIRKEAEKTGVVREPAPRTAHARAARCGICSQELWKSSRMARARSHSPPPKGKDGAKAALPSARATVPLVIAGEFSFAPTASVYRVCSAAHGPCGLIRRPPRRARGPRRGLHQQQPGLRHELVRGAPLADAAAPVSPCIDSPRGSSSSSPSFVPCVCAGYPRRSLLVARSKPQNIGGLKLLCVPAVFVDWSRTALPKDSANLLYFPLLSARRGAILTSQNPIRKESPSGSAHASGVLPRRLARPRLGALLLRCCRPR